MTPIEPEVLEEAQKVYRDLFPTAIVSVSRDQFIRWAEAGDYPNCIAIARRHLAELREARARALEAAGNEIGLEGDGFPLGTPERTAWIEAEAVVKRMAAELRKGQQP